jgi:hypothetical protein
MSSNEKVEKLKSENDNLLRQARTRNSTSFNKIQDIIKKSREIEKLKRIKKTLEKYILSKELITADILKKEISNFNKEEITTQKLSSSSIIKCYSTLQGINALRQIVNKNKDGTFIIHFIPYGDFSDVGIYEPDQTFTKVIQRKKDDKKIRKELYPARGSGQYDRDLRKKIYDLVSPDVPSLESLVTYKLKVLLRPEAKRYVHHLRTGEFNCVLKQIMNQCELQKENKIIEKLQRLYENVGIPFEALNEISKKLYINIELYNVIGDLIYSVNYSTGKYKTVKCIINKLDHVEAYFTSLHVMKDKKIKYVDDIEKAYNENLYNSVVQCIVRYEGNILYYYDADNIYKCSSLKDYDLGKYFICDDFTKEKYLFDELYDINNNYICKHGDQEDLFNFVMSANHWSFEYYNWDNVDTISKVTNDLDIGIEDFTYTSIADLSKYYGYDMNKNYASYKVCKYYQKYKFPETGKLNFYKIVDYDITKLLEVTGFIQIDNLEFPESYIGINLKNIGYLQNGFVYPTSSLMFAYENDIKFTCKAVAFTNWTYEIDFNDNIIKNKWYSIITGMLAECKDYSNKHIKIDDLELVQDITFYSPESVINYENQELIVKVPKTFVANQCHISAFIISYAFINVMEKLKFIHPKHLIGIKTDCIITKINYDHIFTFSKNTVGDWKPENKKDVQYSSFNNSQDNEGMDFNVDIVLTEDKLNYKKINMITGPAGTGKTMRFIKKFEKDERLFNCILAFPTNKLKSKFNNDNNINIQTITYHKLFGVGCDPDIAKLRRYTDVILDEATMLSLDNLDYILKVCRKKKINLFLVGDYNYENKKMYQLKPVCGESFLNYKFDNNDIYCVDLSVVYRSINDKRHIGCTKQMRGKSNHEALAIARLSKLYKCISIDEIDHHYDCDTDICLASTNEMRRYINGKAVKKEKDKLRIKFGITDDKKFSSTRGGPSTYKFKGETYYNNEELRINKEDFDHKKMEYAYCITNHLCQGLEWDQPSKIFILVDRFFEDNMVYVCFSRAKESSQIILVYPNEEKIKKRSFDEIVLRKLKMHRDNDKKHMRKFDLDYNFVLELFKKYNGKCKYCSNTVMKEGYTPFHPRQWSIDRTDNRRGHLKTNVVLSCLGCNSGQSRKVIK